MSINKDNFRTKTLSFQAKRALVDNGAVVEKVLFDLGTIADEVNSVITGAALIKKSYTIGIFGVSGCDYNFASAANTTEQSIQLGSSIIPALSSVTSLIASCSIALVGGTATCDIGVTSGSDEYASGVALSSLNATLSSSAAVAASGVATSIYFSVTPSANWNSLSAAKWTVNFYYVI